MASSGAVGADRRGRDASASRTLRRHRRSASRRRCSGASVSWPGDVTATSELSASSFDRDLDWWWRRTSFSDITAGTYEARVASEPEEAGRRRRVRAARAAGGGRRRRRAASGAVAARRDAGRGRGRDAGPPRLRVAGLRGGGSRPGAGRAGRGRTGAATGRARRPRGCRRGARARRSRRRWGRWRAASRCATSRAPTGSTSSTSSCPLVGGDDPSGPALTLSAIAERAARALGAGRSAGRLRGAPARPAPALERARLPRGQHRPRPATPRRALRRRRLQDQLARAAGRGPDRLAPPPGRAQRRDDALALRPPGAALHGRAAPLPALAAAGLLGRSATSRASCTCSCAG